ncbi:DUF3060 domain-containing protein [Mycobacterium sp. 852014-50255_SCH5639931]|uniref:DUF3060 domain-containing protein n=1 Tax=Mycobacterium sp. 852014-50255_SCH5639931 TaxID=1834112 RepID=UPI0009EF6263|nr:DUF3060 domain-containing protein [Mycobacterium sp. 852014-50255_SCH5639931]
MSSSLSIKMIAAVGLALLGAATTTTIAAADPLSPPAPLAGPVNSVDGLGGDRTVACDNGTLYVSGGNLVVTVTGNCDVLNVSGTGHKVTVDSANSIMVSGGSNEITYHSGTPAVNNTGNQNVVHQG